MSMGGGYSIDPKGVLIDKLGEDTENFALSNVHLKNGKGLTAIYEVESLTAELLDFARDPEMNKKELDEVRPRQPDTTKLSEQEANEAISQYHELMRQWEMANLSRLIQVPIEDVNGIDRYMKRYWRTIYATPAVKSIRFRALTRDPVEQQGSWFGFGKKGQGQQG